MSAKSSSFNPRLPRGKATRCRPAPRTIAACFNPRLPRGKATTKPPTKIAKNQRVSIHAFREGRRPKSTPPTAKTSRFNPRLPRGKATPTHPCFVVWATVSIHAFREGRRPTSMLMSRYYHKFQSTPSAREGDTVRFCRYDRLFFGFNPRLPRGKATSASCGAKWCTTGFQSTPSAREGDTAINGKQWRRRGFNPRLPRGKATYSSSGSVSSNSFQSTPSAREGDVARKYLQLTRQRFNPRLPRGKATHLVFQRCHVPNVSIHAFREGRRLVSLRRIVIPFLFQSTPSAREGDLIDGDVARVIRAVSIHAFREGRRLSVYAALSSPFCFNPRLPRGKATVPMSQDFVNSMCFNPRLPRGKATYFATGYVPGSLVSIHAFREGRRLTYADLARSWMVSIHAFREGRRPSEYAFNDKIGSFNPRLPRGKATDNNPHGLPRRQFQSTPSAREGDIHANQQTGNRRVSIHAFREGRRHSFDAHVTILQQVSIHAFREGRRPVQN